MAEADSSPGRVVCERNNSSSYLIHPFSSAYSNLMIKKKSTTTDLVILLRAHIFELEYFIIKAKYGICVTVWAPKKCKSEHKQLPKLKKQNLGSVIYSPAAVAETFLHVWTGGSSHNSRCPTVACPSQFVMRVCSADESQLELLCPAFTPVSRNFSAFTDSSFCPWQKKPSSKSSAPDISVTFFPQHGLHVNLSQCLWGVKS